MNTLEDLVKSCLLLQMLRVKAMKTYPSADTQLINPLFLRRLNRSGWMMPLQILLKELAV